MTERTRFLMQQKADAYVAGDEMPHQGNGDALGSTGSEIVQIHRDVQRVGRRKAQLTLLSVVTRSPGRFSTPPLFHNSEVKSS
jgi:hypothetical protein